MNYLEIKQHKYITPSSQISVWYKIAPSLFFYPQFLGIVYRAAAKAKRQQYPDQVWGNDSLGVLRLLENAGLKFDISGFENLENLDGPCIFIGNHMSIMETLVLPVLVLQYKPVTFVVKDSLLTYPVFKHIMQSRNPIAVTRTNPRQDLKTVMTEGVDRLKNGISVIVFPQTTRSTEFDAENFGTIGTKLAKKAGVPIVPLALKTDAWKNGKYSKDFGRIYPDIPVRIAFGKPLEVDGKGTEQHAATVNFIADKLKQWQEE